MNALKDVLKDLIVGNSFSNYSKIFLMGIKGIILLIGSLLVENRNIDD